MAHLNPFDALSPPDCCARFRWQDFITLGFIDPDVDIEELRKELLPALSNVFDQVSLSPQPSNLNPKP